VAEGARVSERLQVEVICADEVRQGDRAWVRGRWRTATRIEVRRFGRVLIWWDDVFTASVEPCSSVLRVVRAPAEASFRIFTCAHSHRFAVGSREDLRSLRCAICGTISVEPVPS
jgi:hypothetical protein